MLACVLMLRILQDHPAASIVYFDNKRAVDKYICFAPGSEPRVANKLGAFRAELQQASTILIFDEGGPHCPPVPATGFNAQHIVLSSANPEHYSEWAKNHPLRLVLPTWSLEEIKQAYAHIYTDAKFADYEARFRTLGGVPRYVFAPDATFIEIRDRFKQEIPNADDIARLLMTIDQTAITVQKGARLLTYEVDAELQVVRTRWVSDQIGQWSMERLALSDEKRMMDLLCVMAENPSLGGQFGLSFEPWAHLTLAKGGTFHIRELGKADTGATLQLIKSGTTTYFDDFNMVQDKVSELSLRTIEVGCSLLS